MASLYRKLTEAGLDKKDIEIMSELSAEKDFSEEEYKQLAKKVGIDNSEAKLRIKKLRGKKILLKDRVSILDQVKIWDGYYIAFIKAAIQPPVIGMEMKFPTGWAVKSYLASLREIEKEMKADLIRHAYTMQGTEWDIMLIVSARSQKEYVEFMSKVAKQGWMAKGWSMTPVEYGEGWIFDPVSSPSPEQVSEEKETVLKDPNDRS